MICIVSLSEQRTRSRQGCATCVRGKMDLHSCNICVKKFVQLTWRAANVGGKFQTEALSIKCIDNVTILCI